jgi:putative ABC transport system permease protein
VRDAAVTPPDAAQGISYRGVTPGYFETLRIPLLAGTVLQDAAGRNEVMINQTLARQYFGNDSPVGRYLTLDVNPKPGHSPTWFRVAGVVGDIRQTAAQTNPVPEAFFLMRDVYWPMGNFVLRTSAEAAHLNTAIRRVVADVDPAQTIRSVAPLETRLGAALRTPRVLAWLMAGFALTALLLATVGLYGLLASEVTRLTREIGVRLALGAAPSRILRACVFRGVRLAIAGLVAGIVAALWLTPFLAKNLYRIEPGDAASFAAAAVVLTAVAVAAGYMPARRAARIQPIEALRHE